MQFTGHLEQVNVDLRRILLVIMRGCGKEYTRACFLSPIFHRCAQDKTQKSTVGATVLNHQKPKRPVVPRSDGRLARFNQGKSLRNDHCPIFQLVRLPL
jgi:hypothetical protein